MVCFISSLLIVSGRGSGRSRTCHSHPGTVTFILPIRRLTSHVVHLLEMASILCNKSSFAGATKVQSTKRSVARSPLVVRAQQESVDVVR